jgi:hypothetical protein
MKMNLILQVPQQALWMPRDYLASSELEKAM